jgi:Cu/Ag efflux protein CusF
MRLPRTLFLTALILSLNGCASYTLEPLTTKHPAHPDAVAAARPPRSQTLAYTSADLPARVAAADAGGHDGHHAPTAAAEKTAVGEGHVVAVVPATSQLVVQHGEIKGFMDPMTMGYRTEPPSLLEGLKPGDKIRFSIDVEKKVIVKIEKMS